MEIPAFRSVAPEEAPPAFLDRLRMGRRQSLTGSVPFGQARRTTNSRQAALG